MSNPQAFVEIYDVSPRTENSALSGHTQEHYELSFLLEGTADYYVESSIYSLHPGDLILTVGAGNIVSVADTLTR